MIGQPISRRSALLGTAASATALTLGRFVAGSPAAAATTSAASTFYKGADISWAPALESEGKYWRNSAGTREDLLTILKGYGLSAVRLRTFVHPSNDPSSGRCDINATAAMALRVQNAGMKVSIDYHFSDTWADEGHQKPPAAWKNMSYSQMRGAIASYVNSSMNVIKAKGVTPTWVQIGNEINHGICNPVGDVSNPAQMTGLLNTAHDAVKGVFPDAIVVIHLASPQKSSVANFFNAYSSHGGKWDMNGFSCYGSESAANSLVNDMKSVSNAHGKPYMQVEFGGTKAALMAYITALKKNGGQGLLYWEPEVYAWNSTTREPTSAMDGFTAA